MAGKRGTLLSVRGLAVRNGTKTHKAAARPRDQRTPSTSPSTNPTLAGMYLSVWKKTGNYHSGLMLPTGAEAKGRLSAPAPRGERTAPPSRPRASSHPMASRSRKLGANFMVFT